MSVAIALTRGGYVAFVSECDAYLGRLSWTPDKHKLRRPVYATNISCRIWPDGHRIITSMHRLIMERMIGRPLARSEDVDHIDCNGLNNIRENLRIATRSQNKQNVIKVRTANRANASSIYKGVSWNAKGGFWCAFITINGKSTYLGRTHNEIEAARLYDAAARKHFKEFGFTNFTEACI